MKGISLELTREESWAISEALDKAIESQREVLSCWKPDTKEELEDMKSLIERWKELNKKIWELKLASEKGLNIEDTEQYEDDFFEIVADDEDGNTTQFDTAWDLETARLTAKVVRQEYKTYRNIRILKYKCVGAIE